MKRAALAALCLVAAVTWAEELPRVAPEAVGVSGERLSRITGFTRSNVEQGKHAGIVTMVARRGKIVHFEAVGQQGIDDDRPMRTDSLFRIFSMTKPITSVAVMMLYEEGELQMGDPVARYLPALADLKVYRDGEMSDAGSPLTIEQLLTHTAGLSYGFERDDPVDALYREAALFESRNIDEFIERLSRLPLRSEPGERYFYSVATDVLGAVVEKISGRSLDAFFRERIFEPLGMRDTFFNVPEEKRSRLATLHRWDWEQQALTLMPDGQGRSYADTTLYSGGGGLYSTAMDYMIFCEMLRRGGSYNGARLLGPKTVQYMTINHLPEAVRNLGAHEYPDQHLYPGQYFGLGFGVIVQPGFSQVVSSAGEYSWGGAADTKFWVDPEEDLVAILMTQLIGSPWETRYQMKVATYQALTELGRP
jgi:CubicO group peptidase (beta-lactamase class C family)